METVNLSLPSTHFSESDQEYQNYFRRWYEKLSLAGEKHFLPHWLDKNDQDPDKWPFY